MKFFHPLLTLTLALISCAPTVVAPRLEPVSGDALAWSREFTDVLTHYRIGLTRGQVYRYDGADERAFLAAVDGFYLEAPGYCPTVDAYQLAATGTLQMTLAAKDNGVRALIYDLSAKPRFIYAILEGSSAEKLPVTPCRTATR